MLKTLAKSPTRAVAAAGASSVAHRATPWSLCGEGHTTLPVTGSTLR